MANIKINPTGKHSLRLIDVTERPSKVFPGEIIVTMKFETMDTDEPTEILEYFKKDRGPVHRIHHIVNRLSKWYGARLGRSITILDLNKLIGKSGLFTLEEITYAGKKYVRIQFPEKINE